MKYIPSTVFAVIASLALCHPVRAQIDLSSSDIVAGHIQLNYNAKDDVFYANGTSTTQTFADVASTSNVIDNTADAGGSPSLEGTATPTSTFTLEFVAPAGYAFSSLSLGDRFTTFYGSASDSISLAISTNDVNFTTFDSLSPDPNSATYLAYNYDDSAKTTDLSSYVAGSSVYYIEGTFSNSGDTGTNNLQIFRTDSSGNSNSYFTNNIGLEATPEPSTMALLSITGLGALVYIARRRKLQA